MSREPDQNKLEEYKFVKIVKGKQGVPNFHFEINGKYYVYRYRGIRANYKISLVCSKDGCGKTATITPSEFLKEIIQNSPENSKYPKFFDKSDPKVYEMQNYYINSIVICGAHTCRGIEPDHNEAKYRFV